MGVEAAGIVEKIGDKVDGVAVGERVAYVAIGSGEYFMFTHSFVHLMEIVQIGYLQLISLLCIHPDFQT